MHESQPRGVVGKAIQDSESPQIRAAPPGQTQSGNTFEDEIFDPKFFAILTFAAFVAIFVHGVDVGLEAADFRVRIQPAVPGRDQRQFHEADGCDDVTAFVLGKKRVSVALKQVDIRVAPHHHIEIAVSADFLENERDPSETSQNSR